jgi:cytochrome c
MSRVRSAFFFSIAGLAASILCVAAWGQTSQEQGHGEGDTARGKALFEKRCTGCHALTENHEGPALKGVYGRTSGAAAGFAYSAALKKAAIVWNDKTLDQWLADPDAFIAGNEMDFLVSKPQERQDLISYLRTISGR